MTTSLSNGPKNTVALFGVPRSGTSWLGQIFNSSPHVAYRYQPLFSYEFKDRLDENATNDKIQEFHHDLLRAKSDFVLQTATVSGNSNITFAKKDITTLVWKEVRYLHLINTLVQKSDIMLILLARHPCATINSWLRAPKEFNNAWDPLEEWRFAGQKNLGKPEEYNGFEKWKEAIEIFLEAEKKYPEKVKIVKYEDLNDNSLTVAKQLFSFVGQELESQTEKFIKESQSSNDDDPYGVFRQQQNTEAWRDELDKRIIAGITKDLAGFEPARRLNYS